METTSMKKHHSIVYLTETALMAAILCICGPQTIPIGPVPITLFTFALSLCSVILGRWMAPLCVVVYLLLGMVGLPVFSGGGAGLAKIVGPTGGYLVGGIFHAFVGGLFAQKFIKKIPLVFLGQILGLLVVYLIGTIWFMFVSHMELQPALAACVYPFVGVDCAKLAVASAIGIPVRRQLVKANLLK